jgi:thiol-disulfide isomerase/thioredoxin
MVNKIVLFHWNSCGHCQTFKPIWEEIVQWVKKNKDKYNLIAENYEANEDKTIVDKNKIEGYPTIRLFTDNGFEDLNTRDKNEIIDIITKKIGKKIQTDGNSNLYKQQQIYYEEHNKNGKINKKIKGFDKTCIDGKCEIRRYPQKLNGGALNLYNPVKRINGGNIVEPFDPNENYYQKYVKYKNKYLYATGYNY